MGTFARDMGVRLAHHAARSLFYQELTKSLATGPVEYFVKFTVNEKARAWRRYHMEGLLGVKQALFAAAFRIFLTLRRIRRVTILRVNVSKLRDGKANLMEALV